MKNESFDLPMKSENIAGIINSSRRKYFIEEYPFFGNDGNKSIYEQWILENISTNQNSMIEDIFKLAGMEYLIHSSILEFALKVLSGRYSYFAKLECLVYHLRVSDLLEDRNLFIRSANVAIQHTRNELVKFQANLNLAKYDNDFIQSIKKGLLNTPYPTLFYRATNLLWLYPKDKRDMISKILQDTLDVKKFSNDVKKEILLNLSLSKNM